MADMLVKLYEFAPDLNLRRKLESKGFTAVSYTHLQKKAQSAGQIHGPMGVAPPQQFDQAVTGPPEGEDQCFFHNTGQQSFSRSKH